jgi:hypothetical protein
LDAEDEDSPAEIEEPQREKKMRVKTKGYEETQ